MPFKSKVQKEEQSKEEQQKEEAPQQPPEEDTLTLELALYTSYMMGGYKYEKGVPYKFRRETALDLLAESDTGRPIWKQYRKPIPKHIKTNETIDARNMLIPPPPLEPIHGVEETESKRIDVGSEEEFNEILQEKGEENVTI